MTDGAQKLPRPGDEPGRRRGASVGGRPQRVLLKHNLSDGAPQLGELRHFGDALTSVLHRLTAGRPEWLCTVEAIAERRRQP